MKLRRATFLGIRGLPDVTIDLTDPATGAPHAAVVVTGPAASGKTRLLEALVAAKEALGPYGPMITGAPWIREGSAARIHVTFHLDEAERAHAGTSAPDLEGEVTFTPGRVRGTAPEGLIAVLERYSHDRAHGKLEYFPATRRLPAYGPFHGLGAAEQRLQRASRDARKYSFVVTLLRELARAPERAALFAERLEALSATCRYVPTPAADGMPRCLSSKGGPPVAPTELADSEADAVLFAATSVAIGLDRSLVLVDRPELYADAAGLELLLAGLPALGAGNQLVLASSRPEVAAFGGGPRHVVTLKEP